MTIVSEARYRILTTDLVSERSAVLASLASAQELVEERVGRALEYGEHTERLTADLAGLVYPSVTPLDPTTDGFYDVVTLRRPSGSWLYEGGAGSLVTYVGGYTAQTCPSGLAQGICLLAQSLLDGVGVNTPANEGRVTSLGDVTVQYPTSSGGPSSTPGWPQGVWPLVRRYRHRSAVAW